MAEMGEKEGRKMNNIERLKDVEAELGVIYFNKDLSKIQIQDKVKEMQQEKINILNEMNNDEINSLIQNTVLDQTKEYYRGFLK